MKTQMKLCRRGHKYNAMSSHCPICWPGKEANKKLGTLKKKRKAKK